MKIEVKGKQYYGFTSATAIVKIDSLCNSFSFASGPGESLTIPFSRGDECIIYADGEQVVKGYVEIISGSGSSNSHVIDITGRDRCSDIVDSSLNAMKDIRPPISFKQIVEIIVSSIGSDLDVIDYTDVRFDKAEDLISPERGDNAFQFLEKLARKKNVILSSNSDGDVVIQNSIGKYVDAIILNSKGNPNNNVIQYSFSYDDTGRFNRYEVVGNQNINVISNLGSSIPRKVVNQRGFVIDSRIREGRQFVLATENPGSSSLMESRASWELNIRRARSRTYNAVVSGFRNQSGELWSTNTLVRVLDEHAQIDDIMLINSVIYRMEGSGRTCEVGLVNRDAYTLSQAEIDLANKSVEDAFVIGPAPKSYTDKYRR